jgi:peptidoglycan/LPS O-acetylase OafA/YrhL
MPGSPESFKLGYQPALDGLRGVAVLAVLAYHAGWISGGYLGVDVFFTLSGFLITTLLCEEHARTGTISIRRFYVRRARRLLPALVLFLLVWEAVFLATTPPQVWPLILGDVLGVLGYVTNWLIISYWRPAGPFGHTWSLAVEEQFYLVWPVLLLLFLRRVRSPRWLVAGFLTAAAGSLTARLALWSADATFTRLHVGTDTHADGLLLGAAFAVWLHQRRGDGRAPASWRRVASIGAALGLLGLFIATPLITGYVYGATVLAALATNGLIFAIVAGGSRVSRWLASGWLVRIGWISYGIYLWHVPFFLQLGVLRQPGDSAAPVWRVALASSLTFAAALCSYVLIERPFLTYKARPSGIESAPVAVVPPATKNGGLVLPSL